MKMKKISAFALAGLMGLSLAGIPAQAADGTGNTDVVYTIGSTMTNNLVMVMPADLEMFPDKLTSDERTLLIRNMDSTIGLVNKPTNKGGVIYNIEVESKYGSKFLVDDGSGKTNVTTDVGYDLMLNRPNWLTLDGNRTDVNLSADGLRTNKKADVEKTAEADRKKYDNAQGDDAGIPAFEYKLKSVMMVEEGTNTWVKVDDTDAATKAKRLKKVESLGKNGTTLTDTLTFKLTNVVWK